jgi:hypothetical protein
MNINIPPPTIEGNYVTMNGVVLSIDSELTRLHYENGVLSNALTEILINTRLASQQIEVLQSQVNALRARDEQRERDYQSQLNDRSRLTPNNTPASLTRLYVESLNSQMSAINAPAPSLLIPGLLPGSIATPQPQPNPDDRNININL